MQDFGHSYVTSDDIEYECRQISFRALPHHQDRWERTLICQIQSSRLMVFEGLYELLFEPFGLTGRDVVVLIAASTVVGYFYWKVVCKNESILHSTGPDNAFFIEVSGFVWVFRWLMYARIITVWVSDQFGGAEIVVLIPVLSLAVWSDYYIWFDKNPVQWHISLQAPVDVYKSLLGVLKTAVKDVLRYRSIDRRLLKDQIFTLIIAGMCGFWVILLLPYLVESIVAFRLSRILIALMIANAIMLILYYLAASRESMLVKGVKLLTLLVLSFVAMILVGVLFDLELLRLYLLNPSVSPYFVGSLLALLPVNSVIVAMFVRESRNREALLT